VKEGRVDVFWDGGTEGVAVIQVSSSFEFGVVADFEN